MLGALGVANMGDWCNNLSYVDGSYWNGDERWSLSDGGGVTCRTTGDQGTWTLQDSATAPPYSPATFATTILRSSGTCNEDCEAVVEGGLKHWKRQCP